jgi:hypothetical protein
MDKPFTSSDYGAKEEVNHKSNANKDDASKAMMQTRPLKVQDIVGKPPQHFMPTSASSN